ncbi:arginine--tRNA ligase [Buchnera aphidicola]|uniref:arginine--tRNA ligase n=1 Tax=Buchnera aphidicola TaxID=9 RepID=UPI003BEEF1F0
MYIKSIIKKDITHALNKIIDIQHYDPLVKLSKKLEYGHYQINNLIKLSKILKITPFQISKKIISNINNKKMYEKITFSEPGFINLFLNLSWLSEQLNKMLKSIRLGVPYDINKQNIVIDYSSPNIAKEMHVGHLRSTIIGDVIARILSFLGHNVIRANHIGDWGTQFGMLIAYLKNKKLIEKLNNNNISLFQLDKYYSKAKKKYDEDQLFAEKSRKYVVKLQNKDPIYYSIWKKIVFITMTHNNEIYKKLNVTLNETHIMGESLYNDMLPNIIQDLKSKKIAIEKNGAIIVFLKEFKNRLGESMGVIIQKKDKGFLYSTIDIACLKYRYEIFNAHRIIYYTDSRQHQHLIQVWTIAKKANYIPNSIILEHHMFGMMLNKDKKPFKTRDGNTIKLNELLDESIERANKIINEKKFKSSKKKRIQLARIIGISAIKYADLSKNRNTDYIFNWDKMLSFEGNTAPYIQYAYTRIMSIFKKSHISISKIKNNILLIEECEINLALLLLEFEEIIYLVAKKGTPHILCEYLYKVSTNFSNFYENCSILFPKKIKICKSRLKLSFLTAKIIKKGLNMLGIKTVEKM